MSAAQAAAVAEIALSLPDKLNNAALLVALNAAYRAGVDDTYATLAIALYRWARPCLFVRIGIVLVAMSQERWLPRAET